MPLTYVSLCDGIGAVHVAWQPLGWRCAWVSEIEPFPSAVVAHRWGFENVGDMRRIAERRVHAVGAVDLVAGGTPCQSFSLAGRRGGLDDPRGGLALVFAGVVGTLRPRWVVWENVPGVLSSGGGRDFGAFIRALEELGYGLAWRVLDAQFFGVAQRRRRVFIVAYLGDWRPAVAVLLEPQSLRGHSPTCRPARQAAAAAIEGGAGSQSQGAAGPDRPDQLSAVCMAHGQGGAEIGADRAPTLSCNHEAPILAGPAVGFSGKDCGGDAAVNLCPTLRASTYRYSHPNGGNWPAVVYSFQPRIGRAGRGRPSPVVAALAGSGAGATSDSRPCIVNGWAVRRLTPRECERLQGFPDDYTLVPLGRRQRRRIQEQEAAYLRRSQPTLTDEQIAHLASDGPRYRALGNSMAVPVMAWIGRRIERMERSFTEKTPAVAAGVGEGEGK